MVTAGGELAGLQSRFGAPFTSWIVEGDRVYGVVASADGRGAAWTGPRGVYLGRRRKYERYLDLKAALADPRCVYCHSRLDADGLCGWGGLSCLDA